MRKTKISFRISKGFVKLPSNCFCSTRNAYLQSAVEIWFRASLVSATRSHALEPMVMDLNPLALVWNMFFSQTYMHPPITVPFWDFNDTKAMQTIARNMFLDWEKTKGIDAKSTLTMVFVKLAQIRIEFFEKMWCKVGNDL